MVIKCKSKIKFKFDCNIYDVCIIIRIVINKLMLKYFEMSCWYMSVEEIRLVLIMIIDYLYVYRDRYICGVMWNLRMFMRKKGLCIYSNYFVYNGRKFKLWIS